MLKRIRLRTAREKLNLTQVQLAALAKMTQSDISNLETGRRRNPSLRTACRLAAVLGVDPAMFDFSPQVETR